MSTQPPAVAERKPVKERVEPLLPPDENFWQRYSPHHEFPISSGTSVALHVLIMGLLIFAALLASWMGVASNPKPVETEVVRFKRGGGGGDPWGQGKAPGTGLAPPDAPQVSQQTPMDNPLLKEPDPTPTLDPNKQPAPTIKVTETDPNRVVPQANTNVFASTNQMVDAKIRAKVRGGQGRGGTGSGGGMGTGMGTGTGSGTGTGGDATAREKRMDRWVLQFDTTSGSDYLRQLKGLNAILAIPQDPEGNTFKIMRDLKPGGALLTEDVESLNRIYWIDSRPESVRDLMAVLGYRGPQPRFFVAFFPNDIEDKLVNMERSHLNNLSEEQIDAQYSKTIFAVDRGKLTLHYVKSTRK